MSSEDISTLGGDREAESESGPRTSRALAYEDLNLTLTAGYWPTIVVSLTVAVSFVLFGGVIPGMDGDGGGWRR